ncbi:hypothetical protein [Mailhella massiliensis]|uniref:hypothetical protein n=1 Tax=Mailhella massiliensis TaxID=1903261 RepID=UPI00097D0CCC|nr:hypothetical protein [Mailhella massiliensis]
MKYNNDTREQLYLKTIAMFGVKSRLGKALEEFCEASAAITRFLTRPEGHTAGEIKDSLFEELADASIMIEQLELLFSDQTDTLGRSLSRIKEQKLRRLEKLMSGMEKV